MSSAAGRKPTPAQERLAFALVKRMSPEYKRACDLKDKIEAYWRERGHAVEVEIKPMLFSRSGLCARYELISNTVNGAPLETAA